MALCAVCENPIVEPRRLKTCSPDCRRKYLSGKAMEAYHRKGKASRLKMRFAIFMRDGFRCVYCGRTPPECVLEIDHVHPASRGGKDSEENYATACRDCNGGKGDALLKKEYPKAARRPGRQAHAALAG